MSEEDMISLTKQLSDYTDSEDSDDLSSFDLKDICSSMPTTPLSPVRRSCRGNMVFNSPSDHMNLQEPTVLCSACGSRPEYRPAKRTASSRSQSQDSSRTPCEQPTVGSSFSPNKYLLGHIIGDGASGSVRRAVDTDSGEAVAMKTMRYPKGSQHEVAALVACDGHPNTLRLLDHFAVNGELCLVTELAQCDLLQHIEDHGPISEDEARNHCRDLLSAVAAVHQAGYSHRDIKLENLLLRFGVEQQLILADFGACTPNLTSEGAPRRHKDTVGSASYTAPEVIESSTLGMGYEGAAADIWSCGIVIYAMCAGLFPFEQASLDCARFQHFVHGEHAFPPHLSEALVDLLKMMMVGPEKRPTLTEVLSHRWFGMDGV